jgi:hypothetical protein
MPVDAEPTDWGFLSVVSAWNLIGLPLLLVFTTALVIFRFRANLAAGGQNGEQNETQKRDEEITKFRLARLTTLRRIALIHLGVAIRAGVGLAQELATLSSQGIPQSFPVTGIVAPAVAIAANVVIGHGLWHLRPWGRKASIGWDALVGVISGIAVAWQWRFQATARLEQWPDYLVSTVLSWFLLVVMLLPGTRLLFKSTREELLRERPKAPETLGKPFSPLGLCALLFLFVVVSALAVDAAGWFIAALGDTVG